MKLQTIKSTLWMLDAFIVTVAIALLSLIFGGVS